jgi:hypothetical protein
MTSLATLYDPLSEQEFLRRRNQPFVRPGVSEIFDYTTRLAPPDEAAFQAWTQASGTQPTPDYDMRGFWQAMQRGDPRAVQAVDPNDQALHFPDWWKTPLHESFSNESKFAGPGAPQWIGDQLVAPNGAVIFDDRPKR